MNLKQNDAAQVISSILKHDQKVNSYKIALLRSINDVVLSFPDLAEHGKDVAVPLRVLAEYWLSYYWPFMAPETPIYQGPRAQRQGGLTNDVAFRPEMKSVYSEWARMLKSVEPKASDGFFLRNEMRVIRKRKEYSKSFTKAYDSAIKKITSAIKMPIRYAGKGEWQIFASPKKYIEVAAQAVAIPGTKQNDLCLLVSSDLWEGFHQLSLYIEALAIHQWSLFLEGVKQDEEGSLARGNIYEILTARPDNRRPLTWERNRIDVLIMEGQKFQCPWTKKEITESGVYDVDHIIPVSVYPINEMWNLVPSDHEFNSHRKRDRLPGPKALQHAMPIISQTYQTYLLNSELSNALLEDSTNRFLRVSSESFSIPELRNAVQLFVSSVQRARNIATF